MPERKIIDEQIPVSELKNDFGNPRKISKKKREELRASLDTFGNFGVVLIDEKNNIIGGNQRVSVIKEDNPDAVVHCKRLVGYSEAELRSINLKDNVHNGEWDLDLLAGWTADLTIDVGIDPKELNPHDREIPEMELVKFEKYDYVIIACRNELDYNQLTRALGIEGKKVAVHEKRKIKARAIWYDQMKAQIIPADQVQL